MSNRQVQIMPPSRGLPATRTNNDGADIAPARIDPGGVISSTLMRWEAERHARTLGALTERWQAEGKLFDAQTQASESYIKRQTAAFRLQDLPEVLAAEHVRLRAERAEEQREVSHRHELAELRRAAERTHAERALVDAQQALGAQREHGGTSYEIEWKKRHCELLDIELGAAERRAMLREHIAEIDRPPGEDEVDTALYEARTQLRASGLDTTKIDSVLQQRARKDEP
jgi:hypothetical protein